MRLAEQAIFFILGATIGNRSRSISEAKHLRKSENLKARRRSEFMIWSVTPENGRQAIFYTSSPPDFRLEAADWYLYPGEYWNCDPVPLRDLVERFPLELFQISSSGQPPAFYPDRTPDYTDAQEAVMRSILREMVRIGWSLPQYKWFVMERLRKTTARVTHKDAVQLLAQLQQMNSESEDCPL